MNVYSSQIKKTPKNPEIQSSHKSATEISAV
jgi:hypothetical protein